MPGLTKSDKLLSIFHELVKLKAHLVKLENVYSNEPHGTNIDVAEAREEHFPEMESGEPFDVKLEKLMRELNNIKDLFIRVKKNEELLEILTEVDEHLHKLDRKRLEDMEGICKRIRDCAHKLLPMDDSLSTQAITKAFDSTQDHKTEKLHSDPSSKQHNKSEEVHSDPSSSQNKNELLDQHKNLIPEGYYGILKPQSRYCWLSLSVFPEHAC